MLTIGVCARRALCRLASPFPRPGPRCSRVAAGLPAIRPYPSAAPVATPSNSASTPRISGTESRASTQNIRLLSHVSVPAYRHPLQTANSFATLDELSHGRVILGVGAGHVENEFDALGVDFHARGRLLDTAIEGIRAAWVNEFVDGV